VILLKYGKCIGMVEALVPSITQEDISKIEDVNQRNYVSQILDNTIVMSTLPISLFLNAVEEDLEKGVRRDDFTPKAGELAHKG